MNEKHPEQYDAVVAINVDIQNDFCPGGALPVPEGDAVVAPMNRINRWVRERGGIVIFTADWHPEDTAHFDIRGGPWPVHCVRHRAGAAFHDDLHIDEGDVIARKGTGKQDDGYSGWGAELDGGMLLRWDNKPSRNVSDIVKDLVEADPGHRTRVAVLVGGLATDYCVKATMLDALKVQQDLPASGKRLGVFVVEDAIRAVDIQPGDGDAAIAEMKAAGAKFIQSADIVAGKVIAVRGE